ADLNGHNPVWGYASEDTRGRDIQDYVLANDLYILYTSDAPPTYVRRESKGWLDLSLFSVTIAQFTQTWDVLDILTLSDHNYITTTISASTTSTSYRRYKTLHGYHNKLLRLMAPRIPQLTSKINSIKNHQHLNIVSTELQQIILKACDNTYKIKKTYYLPDPNWWTQGLETEKSDSELCEDVLKEPTQHKELGVSWWRASIPIPACHSGKKPANRLANINCRKLPRKYVPPANIPGKLHNNTNLNPDDPPFRKKEVTYVIKNILTGKAQGVDGIDNLIIKILHNKYPFLTSFFNKCLDVGSFPDPFKLGNIVFFLKKGKDSTLPSSYPTISLLQAIRKVLEPSLTQLLSFHFEKAGHHSNRQFGFREGHSVDTALESLLSKIKEARSSANHSIVLSIDIKGLLITYITTQS
ncbi:hypothetical protein AVEN_87956-1, partial [Araneus ventricosus]